MPWDDLEAEILKEFGLCQPDGEDNVFLAQASAMREHERARQILDGRDKAAVGECLDCREPAVQDRRRCALHLAARNARTIAYQARVGGYPLSERARMALAVSRRIRTEAAAGLRGGARSAAWRSAWRVAK